MKKNELLQDPDFRRQYAIVLDGELYKSLPPRKNMHLVRFMNEYFEHRPVDTNLVAQYFNSKGKKIPEKHFIRILEIMADALRYTAELMMKDMSEKAIKLTVQAKKSTERFKTAKSELTKDLKNRGEREKEVQL